MVAERKPPDFGGLGRNDASFIAPVRRRSSAICRMPKSTCPTLAIFPLDEKSDDIASLVLAFLAKHSV
jgi:hypothetical protein